MRSARGFLRHQAPQCPLSGKHRTLQTALKDDRFQIITEQLQKPAQLPRRRDRFERS
jgi:hypothetical protein